MKKGGKGKVNKKCIYCGKKAETKDHIPSKNLYPKTKGLNFTTVPSCNKCNQSFSSDEVFFRDHITAFSLDKSMNASYLFDTKIKRSIIKDKTLANYMFNKMSIVEVKTPQGLYMGKKTAITMNNNDWQHIYKVLDKTIKGLVYIELNKVLPKGHIIKHFVKTGPELEKKHKDILDIMNWNTSFYPDIFLYGFNRVPERFDSIWITQFFGTVVFMTFIRHKDQPSNLPDVQTA
ncbi:hypothetical protein A2982_00605 [candidate division WWE3 bacterium RIFCSPLOWO2_01_FULL_39_13]|uniref:HNH endonuclease 5 domain-containing protein n=1 Tax=candidate division WWE3 bacterium RIFCSPLOWO2_01_FULL_39_13 TaxID=1802624 RepID=A0A1F4V3M1_UNCKA|nr:MAG: hypothetical protein A2982_00605 [candidate division WWE3 bacterium RIFCSPLOWO2_01_FULL_39_13]